MEAIDENDSSNHMNEDGTKKTRLAFLDLLIDLKRRGVMRRTEVREQVDTFMFEVVDFFRRKSHKFGGF